MRQTNWRFSFKVLVPVAIAIVVTLGVSVGFILWSAMKSDDRADADRQPHARQR